MTQMPPSSVEATLFVPMHLDALVVNNSIRKLGITYNRWQMDYDQMNRFTNPVPNQFIGQVTDPPPAGVHLHWTLPAGLAHGTEKEAGQIEFPFVPNRWLVVRIQSSPDATHPGPLAAWVVLSDAYGEDCTSRYLDPHASQPGKIVPTLLGKKVALADWQPKPEEEGEPFLTAIAPGNLSFAAFAPAVMNVFAFHDDLTEIPATKLTYLVLGWYSRPEIMDPLQDQDDWQCKFLFNVGAHFQADLDKGWVSEQLRQVFEDHEIKDLPKDEEGRTRVEIVKKSAEWRIPARELPYDKVFTARLEDGSICVYDSEVTVAGGLNWAVKLDGAAPPKRTLVHGLVYDVEWKPEGALSKPVNIPDIKSICRGVRIAVGNTSMDALTALIDSQARNAGLEGQVQTEFLEAFQYDLLSTLDQVGSKTLLEQQIRQNWFGFDPGGTRWTIVAKEQADGRAGQETPTISPNQEARLAKLNQAQRKLDAERRILDSMQWELYSLWWKSNRIKIEDPRRYSPVETGGGPTPPPRPAPAANEPKPPAKPPTQGGNGEKPGGLLQILQSLLQLLVSLFGKKDQAPEPAIDQDETENEPVPLPQSLASHLDLQNPRSFVNRVIDQQKKVEQLAQTVPPEDGSEKDLEAYAKDKLDLDPEKLVLKPSQMPRFWRPNDPVVLISGLGRPPVEGQEGNLLCRLGSQIIDRISLPGKPDPLLANDFTNLIPSLAHEGLPSAVHPLLKEAFFLDPGNALIIAQNSLDSHLTQETVETAIRELKPATTDGPRGIGRYGALEWNQPWSPLFMDWQVSYYYTFEQQGNSFKKDSAGNYIFAGGAWHFDGTDATWTGPEPSPQFRRTYSGRTFLTPNAPRTFLDRLQKYLQSQPDSDLKPDESFLEKIANWNIQSQTLSGFSEQLALQDLEYTLPPYGPLAELMDAQHQGIPFMNIVPDPGRGGPFFFPLRAGFMKFETLRIIDRFGRTLNLLNANNNLSGSEEDFLPIRGRGMISSKVRDQRLAELPSRAVQSSRMLFRFVSAENDLQETGLGIHSNPVCGWLLPNHIDKSISVYQADGSLLGEILLITKSKTERMASWQPAPGAPNRSSAGGPQAEMRDVNPHLKQLIEALLHRNDQGAAFSNLLQMIDESLWTIDPSGPREDENLSVLIGRPLALVRANLQLELEGKPFYNQAWVETMVGMSSHLKENHGGLLDIEFPVRLGSQDLRNDGLIGYFQGASGGETDYTHFHAVHAPASPIAENSPYIIQIGAGDDYLKLKFRATTPVAFNPDGSVYLTMLIDPRGVVHANSGLLPTKIVELPDRYVSKALNRMAITIRSGPLLLEPEAVRLPLAAVQNGAWTWIQAKDTKQTEWDIAPIVKADTAAHLSASLLNLVEGWLQFSPEKPNKKEDESSGKKTS